MRLIASPVQGRIDVIRRVTGGVHEDVYGFSTPGSAICRQRDLSRPENRCR